jgi:hypothetical protein
LQSFWCISWPELESRWYGDDPKLKKRRRRRNKNKLYKKMKINNIPKNIYNGWILIFSDVERILYKK